MPAPAARPALTRDDLADPIALLNGVPFLNDAFNARRLLAGAAAVRLAEARRSGARHEVPAEAWLKPSSVYALRNSPPMPARPLAPAQRAQITEQLAALRELVPAWAPLLALPVRYARLYPDRGAISASSRAWPQHVLLADDAFASVAELREQLVHELAHQWLYLMQEMWALNAEDASPVTLPSGTGDRTPAEALGAAHVAAALTRLYLLTGHHERAETLTTYGAGCLDAARRLTPAGTLIADHLTRYFARLPADGT